MSRRVMFLVPHCLCLLEQGSSLVRRPAAVRVSQARGAADGWPTGTALSLSAAHCPADYSLHPLAHIHWRLRIQQGPFFVMMLSQLLRKDKEAVVYTVENLTPQTIWFAVYRKKVVLMGSAPVERLSDPQMLQPGETASVQKPDIKLPWKRYIAFAQEEALLGAEITDRDLKSLLTIWVDELNTVVLTEQICEDGVRAVRVSSWTAWMAKKRMAPAKQKLAMSKEAFLADLSGKMLAGMPPHLYHDKVAHVRVGSELCSEEMQFNEVRQRVVRAALAKLTGIDLEPLPADHTPRIQICASGGGYRAMIATLGALIGLEECGVLDTVTSIAGLSGSTWAMAGWYSGGKSLEETRASLCEKVPQEFYTRKLWPDTIKPHVRERIGFDQDMSLVDVMGWHLHKHLLNDLPVKQELWNHPRLSEQAALISDGSKPLPIYTAVMYEHKRYRWAEFTPFEVAIAQDIGLSVPTWAFGRKFRGGVSTDFALEPSLALLQATWGSAFCATVDQMFHELESSDGSEPAALERLMHTLVYEKLDMAEERLITPAKWPNFGHQHAALAAQAHPFCDMKHCKMMDAGVHTNLPLPPLLRKERASDIIICLDQSSAPDIFSTVSIDIAARFAAEEKLSCPDCSEALKPDPSLAATHRAKHSAANSQRCTIIPGDVATGVPTIIYLPLLRNDSFSKTFCPRENALTKGGYCSTFNFNYTKEQVMELSGLTHANIKDSLPQIVQCIKGITDAKLALHKAAVAAAAAAPAATAAAPAASSSPAASSPQ